MSESRMPAVQAGEAGTDEELQVLTEIGLLLSSTLELREAFGKMMQIISDKLSMRRGAWCCWTNRPEGYAPRRRSD